MATASIKGSNANKVTRVQRTYNTSRKKGTVYSEIWEGPIPKAEAKRIQLEGILGVGNVDLVVKGGLGVVTVSVVPISGTGSISFESNSRWSVRTNRLRRDLLTHPAFNRDSDQEHLAAARQATEEGWPNFTPTGTAATKYYKLRRRGTTHYIRHMPVLIRRTHTRSDAALKASHKGVDRAWKFKRELGSPNAPENILGKFEDMPDASSARRQWLKTAPQIVELADDWYDIVQEWLFAFNWSVTLYNGTVEANGANP